MVCFIPVFKVDFKIIPFGIALFWYNSTSVNTPYDAKPAGAQNLLPCALEMRPGTNGFYIIRFVCKKDILITVCVFSACYCSQKNELVCLILLMQCRTFSLAIFLT